MKKSEQKNTETVITKDDVINVIVKQTIESIPVDKANFQHIAQTGVINGSLLESLRKILRPLIENS